MMIMNIEGNIELRGVEGIRGIRAEENKGVGLKG
jgi:hypothetical protein